MIRALAALALVLPLCAQPAPSRLESFRAALAARGTAALYALQNGRVGLEWYAPGHNAEKLQGTASLAKALVGGMTLMVAMRDGNIRPDDPAANYIPAWRNDPQKKRITIRHLATHTSGIEDAEQDNLPHEKLPGWKGAFWRRDPDPFSLAIHQAPVIFEPGSRFHYSNPGMAALAYAVTAATGQDLKTILDQRVLGPLGVPAAEWSIGYGRPYPLDGLNLYANWGGGAFTPRAAAAVGAYMMRQGLHMTAYAGMPVPDRSRHPYDPASGLCWWTNFDGAWPGVPRDAFMGAGANHELLLVIPSLRLVVVRNGRYLTPEGGAEFWKGAYQHFILPAVQAFGAPYPPSPVIRNVHWAPPESIRRDAVDSDNWPLTWGRDNRLYTSYGDGRGFTPNADRKLSLGYAAIDGGPSDFRGANIRSESGERTGDGKNGLKSSGMLMARGTLYMWVRNAANSQLAWSPDKGKTWQWGFRLDTSFGSPSFLNFGPDYQGARDQYVYAYSQDGPSAYDSDGAIVLARAPLDKIRRREAWQFFSGLDAAGRPQWSNDIAARRPVFGFENHCQRTDAVYVPALQRYLLLVSYNHDGGWGIFDAPEPWGPWTAAFHTEDWGLGPTHGYRLPAKWIGPDGRTMNLVFSGKTGKGVHYDAFCVRPFTLELAPPLPR